VVPVLHLKTITKKAKSGDKTLAPNPSFLLPKFAVQGSAAGYYSFYPLPCKLNPSGGRAITATASIKITHTNKPVWVIC